MLNRSLIKIGLIITTFIFFLTSCSQPNSQSLLSKAPANYCSTDPTMAGCSGSGTGSTSTGALEIFADQTNITAAINNSDTANITGACTDQGKFNNRVVVQVFAGEDENQVPYINNEVSLYCQNSGNPVKSGLESNTSDQCIYVTEGRGVIDGQSIYPQCVNGKYGFSVRLGKVLSDQGLPYKKYLVRFKLRTIEPLPALPTDSEWMRVTVDRPLEKPSLMPTPKTETGSGFGCSVNGKASRTNLNILYNLTRSYLDPISGAATATTPVYSNFTAGNTSALLSVFNYMDYLPEGQTYTYQLTSSEWQYSYVTRPTEVSQAITCKLDPPVVNATGAPTANTCYFGVVNPSSGGTYYEYGYRTDSLGWPVNNPSGNFLVASCSTGSPYCTMSGLAANTYHYVAVRARSSAAAGAIVGKWSNAITCKTP